MRATICLTAFVLIAAGGACAVLAEAPDPRPETWFHIIDGNASRAGLTADVEALAAAGFGGIQFFHGGGGGSLGTASVWRGVTHPIPCLSAEWEGLVRHLASECRRVGLSFKMQNCPGWSMSGGPWVSPSHAMRRLVFARRDVMDGRVPEIPVPSDLNDAASDWRDVAYLAFPTPHQDTGCFIRPVSATPCSDGTWSRIYTFAEPVTIRTLELPTPRQLNRARTYMPDVHVTFGPADPSAVSVAELDYPAGTWQDGPALSVACSEATSRVWRLTFASPHSLSVPFVRFMSAARLMNWEGESATTLRALVAPADLRQSPETWIAADSIRSVRAGDELPRSGSWTVLRLGHVNMKKVNAPAPPEATGWECDKLDPRGIECNFSNYIGRIARDVLPSGALQGMIVDSWECERQTWTEKMEAYFRAANGYDLRPHLPALFGWVIGSPATTRRFLRDWRQTISDLVTRNYYGRMAELAHASGLTVAYETAFGDACVGDILEYWKHCDTPMCEFWQTYDPAGGRGHPSYKPVRPCVSAAHIYGKRRVDCEAFTEIGLTWDESPRLIKAQALRHFARGVTHLVTHTCTHQPQTDLPGPGTSFGGFIGTPFVRGQTWWHALPAFTRDLARCTAFLERGRAAVDVLVVLGDAVGHKPPEEPPLLPRNWTYDYVNTDALANRVRAEGGAIVLPDGLRYARLWVRPGTFLLPATARRLAALAHGAPVVRGDAAAAVRGLAPRVEVLDGGSLDDLLWYRRIEGDSDLYFLAAETNGFRGTVRLRTQTGACEAHLDLGPSETLFLTCRGARIESGLPACAWRNPSRRVQTLVAFTLRAPSGWGLPATLSITNLVAWKDLPGVSEEGRHFSGTLAYEATFDAADDGGAYRLDLGNVRDVARVFVNGREAAVLWGEPFRCDITPFVRSGRNDLRLEVTSTWYNRLVWDARQAEAARKTWTIWKMPSMTPPCLLPGAAARESGLLGPVRVEALPPSAPGI